VIVIGSPQVAKADFPEKSDMARRTLRAWSGLAASGNAECRDHRANAQDVPHRLAISIIQHSG
jgi:hypothetical protein